MEREGRKRSQTDGKRMSPSETERPRERFKDEGVREGETDKGTESKGGTESEGQTQVCKGSKRENKRSQRNSEEVIQKVRGSERRREWGEGEKMGGK